METVFSFSSPKLMLFCQRRKNHAKSRLTLDGSVLWSSFRPKIYLIIIFLLINLFEKRSTSSLSLFLKASNLLKVVGNIGELVVKSCDDIIFPSFGQSWTMTQYYKVLLLLVLLVDA